MSEFQWVAAALIAVSSAARLSRLIVADTLPASVWVRIRWDALTTREGKPNGWNKLFHCNYCMSVWTAALVVLTGYFTNWHPVWWVVNGLLGASYLAAILVAHDGDS